MIFFFITVPLPGPIPYTPMLLTSSGGHRITCGRYASYWNAFLFRQEVIKINIFFLMESWGEILAKQLTLWPRAP